jgi:hypothetical protein
MKPTNFVFLATVLAAGAALAAAPGCGGSDSTTGTGGSTSTTTTTTTTTTTGDGGGGGTGTGGSMMPAPPKLGAQIDRFGRPAINTAANHAFDGDAAAAGAAKDAWNANADPSTWASYTAEVAGNLAIVDSLDTVCGNQAFAGPMPVAGRYDTLASVLADDRVWVKTDAATCTVYLAVEANATGFVPNGDCGGRKLDFDVIDESYSLLAIGKIAGVDDGVAADADTKGEAFPYLAAPH